MKTIKKVKVGFRETYEIPETITEGTVYISKKYETAVHKCLCGCGGIAVTPTHKGEWCVDILNGKLTMKPSVLNRVCGSHYIITNGIANFV